MAEIIKIYEDKPSEAAIKKVVEGIGLKWWISHLSNRFFFVCRLWFGL